jgi:hypothetical protein
MKSQTHLFGVLGDIVTVRVQAPDGIDVSKVKVSITPASEEDLNNALRHDEAGTLRLLDYAKVNLDPETAPYKRSRCGFGAFRDE